VAVVTLVVGVPEEDVIRNKMARYVIEVSRGLRETCLDNKMARIRKVVGGRRSFNRADW